MIYDKGYTYAGEWKNGKEHGRGVEIINGGETIKGNWVNDKYSGHEKPD